ncbi:unnamed protein product [Mytilus coruscus]|uniref:Uncharacterized protein n=1 Tax=Mytilus coruscus TaxID=42192 RepID=A0A6J8AVQ6_MYTCO|nr:unnamed protein product [Mytilus coruscus]
MINQDQFRKEDIMTTREGKTIMSTYLAANAYQLEIGADFILDIDSELNMKVVPCEHSVECKCQNYTLPMRCSFKKTCPKPIIQDLRLNDIHQRKVEAEMSQADWLCMCKAVLSPSKAACSIVTSGDIDAIPIHMFALSDNWPIAQGKYSHPVFVVLQKPNKTIDVYKIMSLIEFFHNHFEDVDIAKKISIVLCMESSFDDMRKATMLSKHQKQNTELVYSRSLWSGQLWLPSESAIERIADIINLQIDYLSTDGNPMDLLPNFLGKDCLRKTEDNEVEYYFGHDSKGNVSEIIGQKRRMEDTPQKGRRRKRMTTSTPVKSK